MAEPTETETRETLDEAVRIFSELAKKAKENPESLHAAPQSTPIGRPDEVAAARNPIVRFVAD